MQTIACKVNRMETTCFSVNLPKRITTCVKEPMRSGAFKTPFLCGMPKDSALNFVLAFRISSMKYRSIRKTPSFSISPIITMLAMPAPPIKVSVSPPNTRAGYQLKRRNAIKAPSSAKATMNASISLATKEAAARVVSIREIRPASRPFKPASIFVALLAPVMPTGTRISE